MTRMLQQVVKGGTAQSGSYAGDLAGKTGTTTYSGVKGQRKMLGLLATRLVQQGQSGWGMTKRITVII